ncbi:MULTISPECIES: symporter small accessory protein [Fictibacillus]|nr:MULTISPECIES: symporter small accessory protein [unclassified Fictibacillus]
MFMLGMEDGLIAFVWVATVVSALGCVVFGGIMWNRGGNDSK